MHRLSSSSLPLVALLCDSLPPYRFRVHQRLAAEIPEVRFATLVTHDSTDAGRWPAVSQSELPHVSFGVGEPSSQIGNRRFLLHEWRKGGRIADWLDEHAPAAVVINGYNDPGRLRVLAWCQSRKVPAFLQSDSNVLADHAAGLRRWVKQQFVGTVVRRCFGVMPFGSLGTAYFRRYGAADDRIFLAPLEPDYERIAALGAEENSAALGFGLSAVRRRLIFSGRLASVKRVDLAVRAFVDIADRRPDWDLVIMGDGPTGEALRALVPQAMESRVIWTGALKDDAVFAVLRACDVLVLPSDHEPWALVLNEAAACGLAIVCSNVVGAAAELVRDGVNGRLFPRGDQAALQDALLDATNPAKLAAMKTASTSVLAEWRARGDPVDGFRKALSACGVL